MRASPSTRYVRAQVLDVDATEPAHLDVGQAFAHQYVDGAARNLDRRVAQTRISAARAGLKRYIARELFPDLPQQVLAARYPTARNRVDA